MSTTDASLSFALDPDLKGLKKLQTRLVQVATDGAAHWSKKLAQQEMTRLKASFNKAKADAMLLAKKEQELKKKGLTQAQRQQIKLDRDAAKAALKLSEAALKSEMQSAEELIKRRKAGLERIMRAANFGKKMEEGADKFNEKMHGVFDSIISKDIGKMTRAMTVGLGGALSSWGEKTAKGGGRLGRASGAVASNLGGGLIMGGAVAAGAIGVGKVLADIWDKGQEMNRTLMDSGVTILDMGASADNAGAKLSGLSHHFMEAAKHNYRWGITAKDNLEILGAYTSAGISVARLTENLAAAEDQMQALQDVTATTITYAKLFGMSNSEMATQTAGYMDTLGLSLGQIQEQYSAIAKAARDSGFSSKRFTGILFQATSGMSMYNFQLGTASGLLTQMGKAMGVEQGGEFFSSLIGEHRGEGALDTKKRQMLLGKNADVLARAGAEAASGSWLTTAKESKNAPQIEATLKMFGLSTNMNPKEFARKLARLSDADAGRLGLAVGGSNVALGQKMGDLRGAVGGGAAALRHLTPGQNLMADLMITTGIRELGGRRVDQLDMGNDLQRATAEQLTGKSGEDLTKLVAAGRHFSALSDSLTEVQKRVRSGDKDAAKQWNALQGAQYGVTLNEKGEAQFNGQTVGTDMMSLATNMGDAFLKGPDTLNEDRLLAEALVDSTRSVGDILENGVQWLLSKIWGGMQKLVAFFTLGNDMYATIRQKDIDAKQKRIGSTRKDLKDISEKAMLLASELDGGSIQGPEREAKLKELKDLNDRKAAIKARLQKEEEGLTELKTSTADDKKPLIGAAYDAEVKKLTPAEQEMIRLKTLDRFDAYKKRGFVGSPHTRERDMASVEAEITSEVIATKTGRAAHADRRFGARGRVEGDEALRLQEQAYLEQKDISEGIERLPDNFVIKWIKAFRTQQANATSGVLTAAGYAGNSSALAQLLLSNSSVPTLPSDITPAMAKALLNNPQVIKGAGGAAALQQILGAKNVGPSNDFVLWGGANGIEFSKVHPQDVITGGKPGGPLSKGGAGMNVFNLYGDGPTVLNMILKAQRAGVLK